MRSIRLLVVSAVVGTPLIYGLPSLVHAADGSTDERLNKLEQEVGTLEQQGPGATADSATRQGASLSVGTDGVTIKSADGEDSIRLHGYVQSDGRFYLNDDAGKLTDTFLVRRARPIVDGTFGKYYSFRLQPDFAGTSTQLYDAYIDIAYIPEATVRAGKFTAPIGLEQLQSPTAILFAERSLASDLVPDRDTGIQLGGKVAGNAVSYAVAFLNTVADENSASSGGITDSVDHKAVAARLFLEPFSQGQGVLSGLGFGVAGSASDNSGSTDLPQYKSTGQQTIFSYLAGVTAAGQHTRLTPQLFYYHRNFGAIGEYVQEGQKVAKGKSLETLNDSAWQLGVSWVATGENTSFTGVKPKADFSPSQGQWGAWEVKARYSELNLDSKAFPTFAATTASVSAARAASVGVNWYLSANVKVLLDYTQTHFDGGAKGGNRPIEDLIIGRLQLAL